MTMGEIARMGVTDNVIARYNAWRQHSSNPCPSPAEFIAVIEKLVLDARPSPSVSEEAVARAAFFVLVADGLSEAEAADYWQREFWPNDRQTAFKIARAVRALLPAPHRDVREECGRVADEQKKKWQRIVNDTNTSTIGAACAAKAVEVCEAIAAAIRAGKGSGG